METVATGWSENPLVWLAGLATVVAVGSAIFAAGNWYGKVNADRKAFNEFIKEVRDRLREINAQLREIFRRLPPVVAAESSPLRLTDFGEKIADCLGAEELADGLENVLRPLVAGMTDYDLQEECIRYVNEDYRPSEEIEERIKHCAYQNGIKTEQVLRVLALELRDRLLEDGENTA